MPTFPNHVLDEVDALVHGLLETEQAHRVEQHCRECATCQTALDEAHERLAVMRSLVPSEAAEKLIQRTEERLDEFENRRFTRHYLSDPPPKPRHRWRPFAATACLVGVAALLLGCFRLYYQSLSPTSHDLRVLGQKDLRPGAECSLRVLVYDDERATPLVDVPVTVELASQEANRAIELVSFRTDANGTGEPWFRVPDDVSGEYELRVRAETSDGTQLVSSTIQVKRSWQVMLSTDKPVYKPGQTIHLRCLALAKPALKPVAGQRARFRITDPKGNVVFQQPGVTSKFGISSVDCPLAEEIIQGTYHVDCALDDTSSRVSVEVRDYVLPKIQLSADFDQPFYQPGELLTGRVHAAYVFGRPVADGSLNVEITTSGGAPRVLESFDVRTDAEGWAEFEYRLPSRLVGRPQDEDDARLGLNLTITDSAGQSQTKTATTLVTSRPLRIDLIPEQGALVEGTTNTVYLLATYADGQPAEVRVAVSGLDQELSTDALGAAAFDLHPHSAQVRLTISARDNRGLSSEQTIDLDCDVSDSRFALRTDKAVYDGGEMIQLVVLGHGDEPVFVDFIRDGLTMLTQTVEVRHGRGELAVDVPPEIEGTVQLVAYRFSRTGLPVRKARAIYVRPARKLKLKTIADLTEYRPGTTATIGLEVTDEAGRPAPGALSLAVVDEAVFSVGDQRPGLEQEFFLTEQELLEPIYAVYDWSPIKTDTFPVVIRHAGNEPCLRRRPSR